MLPCQSHNNEQPLDLSGLSEVLTNVRQYDIGTPIDIQIVDQTGEPVDITPATQILFNFKKPNYQVLNTVGTVHPTEPSVARYVTVLGDMDVSGDWDVEVNVTLPEGTWTTSKNTFEVTKIIGTA